MWKWKREEEENLEWREWYIKRRSDVNILHCDRQKEVSSHFFPTFICSTFSCHTLLYPFGYHSWRGKESVLRSISRERKEFEELNDRQKESIRKQKVKEVVIFFHRSSLFSILKWCTELLYLRSFGTGTAKTFITIQVMCLYFPLVRGNDLTIEVERDWEREWEKEVLTSY